MRHGLSSGSAEDGNEPERKTARPRMKADLCVSVLLVLVAACSAFKASSAFAQDEPDLGKEKRLHQIYRNYYSSPTSTEKWNEAVSKAKNQTYTVQRKDTLWDISETFFADPNFWPKIWSLNPDITNPHEINPSNVVSFSPGTASEPPALAVNDSAPEAEEVSPTGTPIPEEPKKVIIGEYIDVDLTQVKIPPPRKPARPNGLPRSVPAYRYYRDPIKDAKLEVTQIRRASTNVPMIVSHFISENEVPGAGTVLGSEFGFKTAGEGREILIQSTSLTTGNRVLAIRKLGPVKGFESALAYEVSGQLEIKEAVNSAESIYRALVVKSVSLVETGDELIVEEIPSALPESNGTMSPINGKIVGGQFSTERRIFSPFNIVYLNAGSAQGLSVGSHVPVYRNPTVRDARSLIKENPAEIGELQIVRVSDSVATAVIVRQLDDIRVGDVMSPAVDSTIE